MTAATASAWVADRLRHGPVAPQPGRDSKRRAAPGGDALRRRPAGCSARPGGEGRLTLEQRLDSVWEGLRAAGAAECPVCHGRIEGFGPARCTGCGSELL